MLFLSMHTHFLKQKRWRRCETLEIPSFYVIVDYRMTTHWSHELNNGNTNIVLQYISDQLSEIIGFYLKIIREL